MKTKEELNALKAEVENLNKKLRELTPDELKLVVGGEPGYEPITTIEPGTTSLYDDPMTKLEMPGEEITHTCFESSPKMGAIPDIDCNNCDQRFTCNNSRKTCN